LTKEQIMRVLLAGAGGALGHTLGPALVRAGHETWGTTRSERKYDTVAALGLEPVAMDGLDRDSVLAVVDKVRPDVVIHQLTALAGLELNPRRFDGLFHQTNLLRTVGTDHLLEASRAVGVRRFVAQSFTGWTNPRDRGRVVDETVGLDPHPARQTVETLAAIRHLEEAVTGATDLEGVVLRYGGFYGRGTGLARDGDMAELVRRRKLPIVGNGAGLWSFVHVVDASSATVAAVDRGRPGIYNITDDEPAPIAEWLPALAEALDARPPRHLPAWLAGPLLGEAGLNLMTRNVGSANGKAKRELGWTLRYPSWREGFRSGLG